MFTLALLADPEIALPDHVYVTPVAGKPLTVTNVFVHVIVGVFTIAAVGLVVCVGTTSVVELLHALAGLVTPKV